MHMNILIFNPELGQQTKGNNIQKKGIACECVLKVNVLRRNNQHRELFLFIVWWTMAKSFKIRRRKCRPRRSIKISYY